MPLTYQQQLGSSVAIDSFMPLTYQQQLGSSVSIDSFMPVTLVDNLLRRLLPLVQQSFKSIN